MDLQSVFQDVSVPETPGRLDQEPLGNRPALDTCSYGLITEFADGFVMIIQRTKHIVPLL